MLSFCDQLCRLIWVNRGKIRRRRKKYISLIYGSNPVFDFEKCTWRLYLLLVYCINCTTFKKSSIKGMVSKLIKITDRSGRGGDQEVCEQSLRQTTEINKLRFILPWESECQPIFQNSFQIFQIKFLFLVQSFQKHIALVYFLKRGWSYMFLKAWNKNIIFNLKNKIVKAWNLILRGYILAVNHFVIKFTHISRHFTV